MSASQWRFLGDKTLSATVRELQSFGVRDAGFDSWLREIHDPSSETRRDAEAGWIFALSPRVLERPGIEAEIDGLLAAIESAEPAPVVLFGTLFADPICVRPLSSGPAMQARAAAINAKLAAFAARRASFYLVDQQGLALREGVRSLSDPRFEALAQMYWSPSGQRALAALYARALRSLSRPSSKVLVTDLDDTLWGGILGEDGFEGLMMGPTDRGYAHRRYQEALLALKREGVLLAVCSKNDAGAALEALRAHPDCLLRPEDFAALEINWQPKSENLRAMASRLGLGLDSFVFVDDSAFEREEMRKLAPEVRVLEYPADPSGLATMLADSDAFDTLRVTDEDRRRSELYAVEGQRESLRASAPSLEDFYRSLELKLGVFRGDEASAARLHQLLLKTNQFNLTSERPSEGEFRARLRDPASIVLGLRVADRLGDSGLTGCALVSLGRDEWTVDNFLLSCRVIGRTVEFGFLRLLAERALASGAKRLAFRFRVSSKNRPALDFLDRSGLRADGARELWTLDLSALERLPAHFVAIDDGGWT